MKDMPAAPGRPRGTRPRVASAAAAVPADAQVLVALAGFRSALRRFLSFSESASGAVGVTTQQYQAMLAISVHPARQMMIKELAEELMLLPNGAVQLVDRLELAGLAARQESALDRRRVLVRLTAAGERLLGTLAEAHGRELLACEPLLADALRRVRQVARLRGPR